MSTVAPHSQTRFDQSAEGWRATCSCGFHGKSWHPFPDTAQVDFNVHVGRPGRQS